MQRLNPPWRGSRRAARPGRGLPRRLALLPLAGSVALLAALIPAAQASADTGDCTTTGSQVTCTYGYTGAEQTFTVPAGVTSAQVTAVGAAGGANYGTGDEPGGEGAEVTGTLAGLQGGQTLYVEVGQAGAAATPAPDAEYTSGTSAFGGGGAPGTGDEYSGAGGGGGASDVRTVSSADDGSLASRLIVAAGGGGSPGGEGREADGPVPGASAGEDALPATTSEDAAQGGFAGTQTAGGAGGTGESQTGAAGSLGQGGDGGGGSMVLAGGGGGGGLYGGGGGGSISVADNRLGLQADSGGGGGGGSSLVPAGGSESLTTDPASVTISYLLPPTVTTTSLPGGVAGTAYSQQLSASDGVSPYTWAVTAGSLPAGLSLSTAGLLSGTPTASGTFTFTVQAADSESPAVTAAQALTLTVSPASVTVTTTTLPAVTAGTAYSQQLAAAGGVTPYTWTVASGSPPAGLSLSTAGLLSGTPTTPGTSTFTVQATDSESPAQSGEQSLTLTVSPAPLSVTTASLPGGVAGTAYSQSLSAAGGVTPYTWTVASGSLPAGLSLGKTGTITGTPKTAGTSTFTVKVTDAGNPAQTATQQLSITVVADEADLVASVTGPAKATAGSSVTYTLTVTDDGPAPASDVTAVLATSGLTGVTSSDGGTTKSITVFIFTLTGSAWSIPSLAPGQTDTFTVTGTAPDKAGATAATGGALATTPDPDILNNISLTTTETTS